MRRRQRHASTRPPVYSARSKTGKLKRNLIGCSFQVANTHTRIFLLPVGRFQHEFPDDESRSIGLQNCDILGVSSVELVPFCPHWEGCTPENQRNINLTPAIQCSKFVLKANTRAAYICSRQCQLPLRFVLKQTCMIRNTHWQIFDCSSRNFSDTFSDLVHLNNPHWHEFQPNIRRFVTY